MSSPNPSGAPAGPSKPTRPLGTAKPPAKAPTPAAQPGGGAPAQIPRRLAGTVPGIARAASNLRQSSTPNALGNPLASIPAHLRNLSASASAPRIPSPLGKGTPARTSKSNLPVRTSKTTERHVFLPEDPQLAPLPKSPMGSQVNLASMGPPRSTGTGGASGMGQRERERRESAQIHGHTGAHGNSASASASGILIGQGGSGSDERSDAEKMTKREREEARLPRLTAYTTADSYRLKFLQAFLKREHGVGVVRVFDDCVYAVCLYSIYIPILNYLPTVPPPYLPPPEPRSRLMDRYTTSPSYQGTAPPPKSARPPPSSPPAASRCSNA